MPRKGKRRSAAQMRHIQGLRGKRWASAGDAEEIGETQQQPSTEGGRLHKAERDAERNRKDLRNAERRLARMSEKAEAVTTKTQELSEEVIQITEQVEVAQTDCAHWKEKALEIQRLMRRIKMRESRGPKAIHNAVRSGLNVLTYTGCGKPLSIPDRRIVGRVNELVNELVFTWRLPTSMVEGIVYSVVQATVDVCYGGDVDDVDLEMGEHYEFDEPANDSGTSPVPEAAVAGPSNVVVPLPEEPSMEENR